MAKTIFESGTYILANWLNSIFGGGAKSLWQANTTYAAGIVIKLSGGSVLRAIVGGISGTGEPTAPISLRGTVVDNTVTWELFGGHLHDGRSMDGSAPKVALATEILEEAVEYGTFNILFPSTDFTTEQTMTIAYRKTTPVTAGVPKLVTLFLPDLTATSNSTTFKAKDGSRIPSGLRPLGTASYPNLRFDCEVLSNAVYCGNGIVNIDSDGLIQFYTTRENGDFNNGGSKGCYARVVQYSIYPT